MTTPSLVQVLARVPAVADVIDGMTELIPGVPANRENAKALLDSIMKHPLDKTTLFSSTEAFAGYTATQKDGSRRYNFKHLTDWTDLNAKQKAIELVSKNAYIQAQLGNIIVDEDGVIVPQAEPVKTKQSIVLTRIK